MGGIGKVEGGRTGSCNIYRSGGSHSLAIHIERSGVASCSLSILMDVLQCGRSLVLIVHHACDGKFLSAHHRIVCYINQLKAIDIVQIAIT